MKSRHALLTVTIALFFSHTGVICMEEYGIDANSASETEQEDGIDANSASETEFIHHDQENITPVEETKPNKIRTTTMRRSAQPVTKKTENLSKIKKHKYSSKASKVSEK